MELSGHFQAPTALLPGKGPGTQWTEGWLDPRGGVDAAEKRRGPVQQQIVTEFNAINFGAGIAQPVWRLATGWTTEGSEFESQYGQEFPLLHVVQTGSWAHPASYPMDTEGSFPRGKAAGSWSWSLTSN
jgi:hypothetical protein